MTRTKHLRPLAWSLAVLGAAFISNCGGDDSPASDSKKICDPGTTQPCTGPGACQGGQACSPDGKSWGACECGAGGSGGSAATGGGTSGSAGVDASAGSGGVGGGGGLDGGGGGAAGSDGAADAAPGDAQPPGPLDDPCPGPSPLVDHIDINCSDQCQATDTVKCAEMTSCDIPASNAATVTSVGQLPFTIRLPANPGLSCACKTGIASQPGQLQYTLWFKLAPGVTAKAAWARVDKPWYVIAPNATTYDRCVDDPTLYYKGHWTKGCATLFASSNQRWIGVGTNDPNAPSRTLVVRAPWATGTTCADFWQ